MDTTTDQNCFVRVCWAIAIVTAISLLQNPIVTFVGAIAFAVLIITTQTFYQFSFGFLTSFLIFGSVAVLCGYLEMPLLETPDMILVLVFGLSLEFSFAKGKKYIGLDKIRSFSDLRLIFVGAIFGIIALAVLFSKTKP